MKKIFAMALALAMALSLAACGSSGASSGSSAGSAASGSASGSAAGSALTTVEAGKLIMSTNASFPPYEMVKDDGSFEGIDVDIASKIAEKLGLELEVMDMDFTAAVNAPAEGKAEDEAKPEQAEEAKAE